MCEGSQGWALMGPGTVLLGGTGPSQGRTREGVPRALGGCQGLLWLCMTATLRLVFQSGQWGQGWDGGGTKIRSQTQCCSP